MTTTRKCDGCDSTDATVLHLGRRTILLAGPLSDSTAASFLAVFFSLASQNKKPITIKLMSPGGNVESGFAVYDAIRTSTVPVTIEAYGEVSSIAALIFLAGDKRLMSPNCRFMVHHGTADFAGEFKTIISRMDEAKVRDDAYIFALSDRTQLTLEGARDLVDAEAFFSAGRCLELGISHGLLEEKS